MIRCSWWLVLRRCYKQRREIWPDNQRLENGGFDEQAAVRSRGCCVEWPSIRCGRSRRSELPQLHWEVDTLCSVDGIISIAHWLSLLLAVNSC